MTRARPVILITGASGFIGSRTLAPLRAAGFEVHALGRSTPSDLATHHQGDIFDRTHVRETVRRVSPTHVLHCAWEVTHGTFWHDPRNIDWVGATLDLARSSLACGATRFVGVGTCAEYDWSDDGATPRRESDVTGPCELYGVAKDCTHRLLTALFAPTSCSFAWARMFNLFGIGESPARLVPSLAIALKAGRKARCRHSQLTRDFIAVEDAGDALAAIVTSDVKGPINVASGQGVTLADLAASIARRLNGMHLLRVETNPVKDALAMTADITRLREEIGFVPSLEMPERLDRYLRAIRSDG